MTETVNRTKMALKRVFQSISRKFDGLKVVPKSDLLPQGNVGYEITISSLRQCTELPPTWKSPEGREAHYTEITGRRLDKGGNHTDVKFIAQLGYVDPDNIPYKRGDTVLVYGLHPTSPHHKNMPTDKYDPNCVRKSQAVGPVYVIKPEMQGLPNGATSDPVYTVTSRWPVFDVSKRHSLPSKLTA